MDRNRSHSHHYLLGASSNCELAAVGMDTNWGVSGFLALMVGVDREGSENGEVGGMMFVRTHESGVFIFRERICTQNRKHILVRADDNLSNIDPGGLFSFLLIFGGGVGMHGIFTETYRGTAPKMSAVCQFARGDKIWRHIQACQKACACSLGGSRADWLELKWHLEQWRYTCTGGNPQVIWSVQ
jgi:hypothetical protein